jgi:hypothetical protein
MGTLATSAAQVLHGGLMLQGGAPIRNQGASQRAMPPPDC